MQLIDIFIMTLIILSAVISLVRGFIKEAVSLIIWAVAVLLALRFAAPLGDTFLTSIQGHGARYAIAFAAIMLISLFVGMIINASISALVKHTGVSAIDRFLGILFGLARGYLVVTVLILLATFTEIPKSNWWQQSTLIPRFKPAVMWLHRMLPEQVHNVSQWAKKELSAADASKKAMDIDSLHQLNP